MFKVECPGCQAPYQVDERRVPSSGLKMRCPKCGSSFQVDPPADPRATGPSPVLGAALGGGAPAGPKPKAAHKQTMLGVAPGGPAAPPRPAGPPRPGPPRPGPPEPPRRGVPPGPPAIPSGDLELDDLDLPSIGGVNADLPAPVGTKPKPLGATAPLEELADFGDLGVELPGEEADLPAPVAPAPGSFEAEELDLPVVGGRSHDLDLPAPRQPLDMDLPSLGGGGFGEIDLPSVGGGEVGLPQARGGGEFGEVDLPVPSGDLPAVPDVGLPSPGGVGLPSAGGAGLPTLGGAGLPQVGGAGLPQTGGAGLPQTGGAGLPQTGGAGLPQTGGAGLPQTGGAGLPQTGGAGLPQTGGAGLPLVGGSADELELPLIGDAPTEAQWSESGVTRQAGGGTDFGEVNLEPAGGDGALEADVPTAQDDMEFGAIPQEHSAPDAAPVPMAPRPLPIPAAPVKKRRVGLRAAAAVIVVVALGGASLALVPSLGPFGAYWIADRLQSGEHKALITGTLDGVHAELGKDTYPAAKRALDVVEQARSKAKRLKSIAAYSAYVIYLQQLRFGEDSALSSRAKVLLDELAEEKDIQFLALARAAQAASDGQLPRARQMAQALDDKDIDVLALRGELELLAKDPKAAEAAWQAAEGIEKSARTAFGLARAKQAQGQGEAAEKLAKTALKRSPEHVGARTLLARQTWKTEQKEVEATKLLEAGHHQEERCEPRGNGGRADLARRHPPLALANIACRGGLLRGAQDRSQGERRAGRTWATRCIAPVATPRHWRASRRACKRTRMTSPPRSGSPKRRWRSSGCRTPALRSKSCVRRTRSRCWSPTGTAKSRKLAGIASRRKPPTATRSSSAARIPMPSPLMLGWPCCLGQQGRAEEAQKVLADARATLPESPAIHIALGELAQSQGRYDLKRCRNSIPR